MTETILIVLAIIILVLLLIQRGRTRLRSGLRRGKEVVKTGAQKVVGICAVALGQNAKKRERKEKISALLVSRGSASNSDIREALGVSAASVTRYMDELEKEGRVRQIGDVGHAVVYRLK